MFSYEYGRESATSHPPKNYVARRENSYKSGGRVGIQAACPRGCISIHGRPKSFVSFPKRPRSALEHTLPPITWVAESFLRRARRPEREIDDFPESSANVKKV